jgi:pyruvate dehydrogenase E1 component
MRDAQHLDLLHKRLLWLACWMIHHANHLRPKGEGEVKVGGTKPLRPPWRRS